MSGETNPHFAQIDRAPYELGHLLQRLPVNFSGSNPLTPDDRLIAEAARDHAINAHDTLMHGLEALGRVMFVAGANEQNELEPMNLASLGCLISHIAVEAQFLDEMKRSIRTALAAHDERKASELPNRKGDK